MSYPSWSDISCLTFKYKGKYLAESRDISTKFQIVKLMSDHSIVRPMSNHRFNADCPSISPLNLEPWNNFLGSFDWGISPKVAYEISNYRKISWRIPKVIVIGVLRLKFLMELLVMEIFLGVI